MSYESIIDSIQSTKYSNAAKQMLYEALGEKIHSLTQRRRAFKIRYIAKKLESIHSEKGYLRKFGKTPREIAEETYQQACEALGLDKPIEW